jgi:hypothetical protein
VEPGLGEEVVAVLGEKLGLKLGDEVGSIMGEYVGWAVDTMDGEAMEFIVCVKDGTDEEELIVDARLGVSLR